MVYNKKVRVSEVKVALFSHFEAFFEPFLCLSSNFNVPLGIPPALLKRLKHARYTLSNGSCSLGIPPALLKRLKLIFFKVDIFCPLKLGIPPALLKRLKL